VIGIALILAAAAGGVAAGSWMYRRAREATALPDDPDERLPIGLGDVVLLDRGHGRELWAARELTFREADAPPFLVLFEADGRASERAILAFDPTEHDAIAVLTPDGSLSDRPSRMPTTIEVRIEGALTTLSLSARRTATGVFARAANAEGRSELPYEGAALVGIYRGGGRSFAVLVRDSSERAKLYVGRWVALSSVSIYGTAATR
jgi:hypothetical protein